MAVIFPRLWWHFYFPVPTQDINTNTSHSTLTPVHIHNTAHPKMLKTHLIILISKKYLYITQYLYIIIRSRMAAAGASVSNVLLCNVPSITPTRKARTDAGKRARECSSDSPAKHSTPRKAARNLDLELAQADKALCQWGKWTASHRPRPLPHKRGAVGGRAGPGSRMDRCGEEWSSHPRLSLSRLTP